MPRRTLANGDSQATPPKRSNAESRRNSQMLHGASLIASLESVRERRVAQHVPRVVRIRGTPGNEAIFRCQQDRDRDVTFLSPRGNARSAKEPASRAFVDLRRDL